MHVKWLIQYGRSTRAGWLMILPHSRPHGVVGRVAISVSVLRPSLDVRSRTLPHPASGIGTLQFRHRCILLSLEVLLICFGLRCAIDSLLPSSEISIRYALTNYLPPKHDRSTFTPLFCSGGITSIWIRRSCQYWNGPKGKFLSIGNSAPNEY